VTISKRNSRKNLEFLIFSDGATMHNHFVGDISEPSSCSYLIKFYSNLLCKFKKFKGKQEKVNQIKCYIDKKVQNESKITLEVGLKGESTPEE
jgi:hypothetical protein